MNSSSYKGVKIVAYIFTATLLIASIFSPYHQWSEKIIGIIASLVLGAILLVFLKFGYQILDKFHNNTTENGNNINKKK